MIPTRIGQHFEGGHFAGVIRVKDCAYLILVAPKSTERNVQFTTRCSSTPITQLVNDGWTNTNTMNDAEYPAAQYCRSLTVGGHVDLYLPSRDELELCYRNLKPTDWGNVTCPAGNFGNLSSSTGTNCNSIPTGNEYTETNPSQTIVTAFQTGGIESFALVWYWSSTEFSANTNGSLIQNFSNGHQGWTIKSTVCRVRSVRRVPILLNDEEHNDTN